MRMITILNINCDMSTFIVDVVAVVAVTLSINLTSSKTVCIRWRRRNGGDIYGRPYVHIKYPFHFIDCVHVHVHIHQASKQDQKR